MSNDDGTPMSVRWARLRFAIIGPLLAAPPETGELAKQLLKLSQKSYLHPTTKRTKQFGVSTLERWYYEAREADDPIQALCRKVPSQAGTHPAVSLALGEAIVRQHGEHPSWSFQLHYDNLKAVCQKDPTLGEAKLGALPSYTTVRRYMKSRGLLRQRKRRLAYGELCREAGAGELIAPREVRSYEMSHLHALWHLDFHQGSCKVLTSAGAWKRPMLLGILDDYSRLCCHLQWYLDETADSLVHGLSQALLKRGLPRALLTDNGSAMTAAETTEGLSRLSIVHETTLPYSPYQNGKQECFWGQVEGRLLAMLEGEPQLTLSLLNEATQAWVEREYHHRLHSELGQTPIERALQGPSVARPCPSPELLRRAFRMQTTRSQRRSDGTITVFGVRFEIPARYRTLLRPTLRVARWDLSTVDLVDARTESYLCALLPLDKQKNADGRRRVLAEVPALPQATPPKSGIAPHLRALMEEYAATGLPPAYLPKEPASTVQEAPQPPDNSEEPKS